MRWALYSEVEQWPVCLDIATAITTLVPERGKGWIYLSRALHELGRTTEAWENLTAVVDRFPNDWVMHYTLACYACALNRLGDARNFLERAIAVGDGKQVKLLALDDADLEPLWARIGEL
jgi:tetratricopeptide (TPR) repeat protein